MRSQGGESGEGREDVGRNTYYAETFLGLPPSVPIGSVRLDWDDRMPLGNGKQGGRSTRDLNHYRVPLKRKKGCSFPSSRESRGVTGLRPGNLICSGLTLLGCKKDMSADVTDTGVNTSKRK
jgi:hypothetical protein